MSRQGMSIRMRADRIGGWGSGEFHMYFRGQVEGKVGRCMYSCGEGGGRR